MKSLILLYLLPIYAFKKDNLTTYMSKNIFISLFYFSLDYSYIFVKYV